jgi:hypothetical protein
MWLAIRLDRSQATPESAAFPALEPDGDEVATILSASTVRADTQIGFAVELVDGVDVAAVGRPQVIDHLVVAGDALTHGHIRVAIPRGCHDHEGDGDHHYSHP